MADVKQIRRQFVAASVVFVLVTLLALLYLAFPVGASNAELNGELKQTGKELEIKENQMKPLRGLPEKLVKTNENIIKFYQERLPAKQSEVSEELGKLATAEGVTLSDVKYEDFDTDIPELREVMVEAQLTGEYSKIKSFINAAERDKTFLIVDDITLEDQKSGSVRLQFHFETYMRPAFAEVVAMKKPEDVKLPAKVQSTKAKAKQ